MMRLTKRLHLNRTRLVLACTASFLFLELLLRVFLPSRSFSAGTSAVSVPNAAIYGWGYAPGAEIKQQDPDTKETFSTRANSGGWKDVEHQAKKRNLRILILGDSNTFGIVPLEAIYPRVLERMLKDAEFKAEVISMGYGGWGTDQALVALKHSGLSYEPDIVISQFDTNDLTDNLSLGGISMAKPFQFHVVRGKLEMQQVKRDARFRSRVKKVLLKSHVMFHANRIAGRYKASWQWDASSMDPTDAYFVHHLPEKGHPQLEAAWLLYEKLAEEMRRLSDQNGAIFCLFNEVESGHLAWEKRWHRIVEDGTGHDAILWHGKLFSIYYYRHVARMKEIAHRIGALMIPNKRSYTRFDNDPHPNVEGNRRMAEDIFDFLITNEQTSPILQKARKGNVSKVLPTD